MPKELERRLKKTAVRKFKSKRRQDQYVYGTMRKLGWRPSK